METKAQVKNSALKTLHTSDRRARSCAALFIVSIAAIELPRSELPDQMQTLVQNVASGTDILKQSSLTTIGFICESQDVDLCASLRTHSNAILAAVLQGARREELNMEVRCAAIATLGDAVDLRTPASTMRASGIASCTSCLKPPRLRILVSRPVRLAA